MSLTLVDTVERSPYHSTMYQPRIKLQIQYGILKVANVWSVWSWRSISRVSRSIYMYSAAHAVRPIRNIVSQRPVYIHTALQATYTKSAVYFFLFLFVFRPFRTAYSYIQQKIEHTRYSAVFYRGRV